MGQVCCCLVGKLWWESSVIPWTVALEVPLSKGFPRQEYWSGLPFSSPGDLLNPGIKPMSPALQADSLPLSHLGSQGIHIEKNLNLPNDCQLGSSQKKTKRLKCNYFPILSKLLQNYLEYLLKHLIIHLKV